ncbi:14763_t:CDS:2, partial [Cetraspora pellucida]
MPPKTRKRKQNEVTSTLDALRSSPSTSILKKPRNANKTIIKNMNKVLHKSIDQENIRNTDVNDIDDNTQYYEITESPPQSPLNESFTNTLENLSVDPKD